MTAFYARRSVLTGLACATLVVAARPSVAPSLAEGRGDKGPDLQLLRRLGRPPARIRLHGRRRRERRHEPDQGASRHSAGARVLPHGRGRRIRIEGYVPADAMKRLLAEGPDARDSLFPACRSARPAWRWRAPRPKRTMWCSSGTASAPRSPDTRARARSENPTPASKRCGGRAVASKTDTFDDAVAFVPRRGRHGDRLALPHRRWPASGTRRLRAVPGAPAAGRVSSIDNRKVARLAKLAGRPRDEGRRRGDAREVGRPRRGGTASLHAARGHAGRTALRARLRRLDRGHSRDRTAMTQALVIALPGDEDFADGHRTSASPRGSSTPSRTCTSCRSAFSSRHGGRGRFGSRFRSAAPI